MSFERDREASEALQRGALRSGNQREMPGENPDAIEVVVEVQSEHEKMTREFSSESEGESEKKEVKTEDRQKSKMADGGKDVKFPPFGGTKEFSAEGWLIQVEGLRQQHEMSDERALGAAKACFLEGKARNWVTLLVKQNSDALKGQIS